MFRRHEEFVSVTSGPCSRAKNAKEVEELLEKTCNKLNETEVNIRLFNRMVRNGVATNDVRNFVSNQAELKRMDHRMNDSLTRNAMKEKFIDACALARKLKQEKKALKDLLKSEFNYSVKKCRKLVKRTIGRSANQRHIHSRKALKKYAHCAKKMLKEKESHDFKDIPERAWEVVKGVNLFQNDHIASEPSADPMICAPDIPLSRAELAFLKKGPRFMLRQEMNEQDFKTELEKMTVKEKLSALNNEVSTDGEASVESLTEEASKEAAKSAMVYVKSERVLDLG